MTRVAVVLGAGGITSIAWLLGTLDGLRHATGWEPGAADVLCGTSAGAVAAAVTAAGVATERLVEMAEDQAVLDEQVRLATGSAPTRHRLPLAWPGSLALGLSGLVASDPRHRLRALTGLVPAGFRSGDEIRGLVQEASAAGWPTRTRLLLNAVDYGSGKRVTFGEDGAPAVPLGEAVTASAAVPGYYRPVAIDGRTYVDGGVISFSNADVVAPYAPDLVLCLSPFATTTSGGPRDTALLGGLRRVLRRQLSSETRRLEEAGSRVEVLEPTREDLQVMGLKVMERRHSRAVVEQARASLEARIGAHPLLHLL